MTSAHNNIPQYIRAPRLRPFISLTAVGLYFLLFLRLRAVSVPIGRLEY